MAITLMEHSDFFLPNQHDLHQVNPSCMTIRGTLEAHYQGFTEFSGPTVVMLNGEAALRSIWDEPIEGGDHIQVLSLPGFGIDLIVWAAIAAVAAAAYAVYSVKNLPDNKAVERPKSKAAYTLDGESNVPKLGEPIEVCYGRNRWYPGYASRPFRRFIDDQQYLYQLFCLGQGEFDVEKVMIEDTDINSFQEVVYEIYPPGTAASLFPDTVVTSVETQGLELFGTNEAQHQIYGPYNLNPSGTRTNEIEIDVTMPSGMYYMNDDGGLAYREARLRFEVRAIDDAGNPTGGWSTIASPTYRYRTTDPIRRTIKVTVPLSRYQIRGQRINNADTSYRSGNKVIWSGSKAIIPSTRLYGDKTLLAVQMRASNNLNSDSSNRVNVIATRKVPILNRGKWVNTTSRSLVWAAIDVMFSHYGAQVELTYIDLTRLEALDKELEAKGIYFDYIFTQKTKVWEALKLIFKVARAEPIIILPLISAFRYEKKSVPVAMFTPDNIVKGSFEWLINYPDPLEYDGLEVTYIDPRYWKEDVVKCVYPGLPGNNLKAVNLYGCADRDRAFHEGMYMVLTKKEVRETVKFKTGMEGFIPMRGDMIAISYPIPNWGVHGVVTDIADDKRTLTFAEGLSWTQAQKYILIRLDDGSGFGPVQIDAGSESNQGVLKAPLPDVKIVSKIGREPVYFMWGDAQKFSKMLTVQDIQPTSNQEISVTCTNYVNNLDRFDSVPAPEGTGGVLPPVIPDLPEVPFLSVSRIPGDYSKVRAVWGFALGAQYYMVQTSYNGGQSWKTLPSTQDTQMDIILEQVGAIQIRVAGVNVGAGPFKAWSGNVGMADHLPLDVTGLALSFPWSGLQLAAQWNGALDAVSHVVELYDPTDSQVLKTFRVPGTAWSLNYDDARDAGIVHPKYHIRVYGENSMGWSATAAHLVAINPPPPKVTGINATKVGETTTTVTIRVTWTAVTDTDILTYKVWGDTTAGFTPDDSNVIFTTKSNMAEVTVSKVGGSDPDLYARIAAIDVWGNNPVFSDEIQVSSATP